MSCRKCKGAGGWCAGCGEPDCRGELYICCIEAEWVECPDCAEPARDDALDPACGGKR